MMHGLVQTIFKMSPVEKNRIFHISTSIYDGLLYLILNACWGTTYHQHILHLLYILILMTNHDVGEPYSTNIF